MSAIANMHDIYERQFREFALRHSTRCDLSSADIILKLLANYDAMKMERDRWKGLADCMLNVLPHPQLIIRPIICEQVGYTELIEEDTLP